ncbi:transposase [Streptomyces rubrogriseus]|uniref:transposase n=1 Tax=Streptomyces rubrogriseus TaxID=194673 RepID=UPI001942EC3B
MPKPYPKEFREDVVRVARNREPGVTLEQIAADFGVHPITLSKWLAEILHYGSDSLQVHRRLRALLDTLTAHVPPARTTALTRYRTVLDRSAQALPDPAMTATADTPDSQGLGGPAQSHGVAET